MEAFDIISTLSRYYGYTPQQAETAYHLLLQAEALDKSSCPYLTGLICFYRMHHPEVADRILQRDGSVDSLINELSAGLNKPLPKAIEQAVCKVWAYQSMG